MMCYPGGPLEKTVLLTGIGPAIVYQQGYSVAPSPLRHNADVWMRPSVDNNVAPLPLLQILAVVRFHRGRQLHGIFLKERYKVANTAKIDVRVRVFYTGIVLWILCNIAVKQLLELIAGRPKRPPDEVRANPLILRRVSTRIIGAAIPGPPCHLSPGAHDNVLQVINTVAVLVVTDAEARKISCCHRGRGRADIQFRYAAASSSSQHTADDY
jgi:hypothetical protein